MGSEHAYYSLVPNTKSICTYSLLHSWKCLAQLQPETGQPLVFSLKKETVKPEKWQCMNSCALVYRTHTSIFIKNYSKVDGQKIEIFKTRIQFQYTNIKWILKSRNNHFRTLQNEKSTTSQWIGGMWIRVTWSFQYLATSLFICDYLKRELSTKVQTCLQSMDWMLGQCLQFIAQIQGEGLRMLLRINWLHNKYKSKFKKKNVSKCHVDQAYYY